MPETGPRYWLLEDGQPTGPHTLAVLKQKAEIHVITPETAFAPEFEPAAWAPLRTSEVFFQELFPERVRFTLAPKTIEQVNTPHEQHHAPSVHEILRANTARQRAAEGELLKELPPPPNNRRRDYLILAGIVNGICLLNLTLGRPWYDPFLLAFFVMGNVSLVWIMFGVMDRY